MDTRQVNKLLENVSMSKGTFSRNKIPILAKRPAAFVLNTDSDKEPGEHWVALMLFTNGKGEYFDPFGLPPLHLDFISYLNNNASNGWKYNNITIQDPLDTTCGLLCSEYIKARAAGISLVDFLLSKPEQLIENYGSDLCYR